MKPEIKVETRKIGKRVREYRTKKKMSRYELGRIAKVSAGTIRRIEEGRSNFWITTLARIADGLDVRVSDLFPT